ncbi:ligase-associated DNA damage response DEXH box helicase [Marinicauda salina]|uniref:Ligase-associated DNA damage response DEXH box helicase n=1 Tax=Marinicauda salina TaxID=2135793 RepID=A0A2U2BY01_9PROT|nr:ligase-associated DNA damage response DEXH box helicase [Marinicauda salina]PWE18880.1 ligase-associated DNA damage response DEXH box helicase [Marinicauda salina]
MPDASAAPAALSPVFADWFAARGWTPRDHQLAMIEAARRGEDALLIAPTGGGKTLGGFLPSLIELADIARAEGPGRAHRLHTLYVSPLKALSQDVARNLTTPVEEMGLKLRIETRTGDTPAAKRSRQRRSPPDILLTTPEQIALFCAQENAAAFFADLRAIVVDEVHALASTKRGDLLALGLAAISRYAPNARRVGLSATVKDEQGHARWLARQDGAAARFATVIRGAAGAKPEVEILTPEARIPWSGHSGRHAIEAVYERIKTANTALVFVNTRSQAEAVFQMLWSVNDDNLPIALHHGSLSVEQRRKVEAAMAAGRLRGVVCTSTLDLGIDWGDVDLVVQVGAPKGSARLIQRLGRANHRLDAPSKAILVPTNRFEHLECLSAREAVAENALDGEPLKAGSLDVLAQHVMGRACGDPFRPDDLYDEVTAAAPYAELDRKTFDRIVDFVATGGYALGTYDRFRRIVKDREGRWRARNRDVAQRHRMNVGAIVESPMLAVRLVRGRGGASSPVLGGGGGEVPGLAFGSPGNSSIETPAAKRAGASGKSPPRRGGRKLGEIEEWFVEQLAPGDTFIFAGELLRFEAIVETDALVSRAGGEAAKIPSWQGGKFPLSTYLAERVRKLVSDPAGWTRLPDQVREWLEIQQLRSKVPAPDRLLVETFPRAGKHYLVCYPFEGRLAHQTLGMLLTRRLERTGFRPMGFVANEYALSVWGLEDMGAVDFAHLFGADMLGDDLDAWLAESALMKRTFRNCAVIAGLIERRFPGMEKTGRQVTVSADLIYDVLRSHEPDHILLQAAWADAAAGLLDIRRLSDMLARIAGRIDPVRLDRVSPLAVPVMLEIGREAVHGAATEAILAEASEDLIAEAMGE